MAAAAAAAAAKAAAAAAAEVEAAMTALFKAYDIDESGELSREEFLGIEMRLNFEEGTEFRSMAGLAKMTLTDTNSSGTLDYEEFRTRFLSAYSDMNLSSSEIAKLLNDQAQKALLERARMGPRYHAGIRAALRRLFSLFDVDGNEVLSPEEWISAQKTVAIEISDDLDEGWIDEAAFQAADTNGDGMLDLGEFLEASFSMFEGVKKRTDDLLAILQRMVHLLEKEQLDGRKETPPVSIWVQKAEKPTFQPPQDAWKDEATIDDEIDEGSDNWLEEGEIALPLNLATAEDVAALLRLTLKKPPDTWLSVFFLGAPREGGVRPVMLVRGERPGEGNVQTMLQYLCKVNADLRLFVKNVRKRPQKLQRQQRAFMEERDGIMAKRVGQCWGLDWETQLVGDGMMLPPRPMVISVGDALVVEVPVECGAPLDRYVCSIYMDETNVLSKPVDENIVPKAKKKPKGKKAAAADPDPLLQLNFVALKEGKCVLFVDVSWEDQEEPLAMEHKLCKPVHENSIARIGPVEVDVQAPAGKPEAGTFVWWNGEKWSNKKGPAKKKGKKK